KISGYDFIDVLDYSVSSFDSRANPSERFGGTIFFANPYLSYNIDVNRFKLPIDNKGVLADVDVNTTKSYGKFDEGIVLVSAGFGLSGYEGEELWANAVLTASRLQDYQPGIVGSDVTDEMNSVYVVKSSDEPFGASWDFWALAVTQGAKFCDGNGDGVYTPIDLDSNGVWDANDDRPDLIGDATYWTVFNDGFPSALRRYDVTPKEIEIRQTVFGYSPDTHEELDGVLFVRYNIVNKSSEIYEDVYFSAMSDPDLGDYTNDLVGCDTTLNSGYAYDKEEDEIYINSPTMMTTILQGGPVYISGETYTDINGNGIYDEGVDTPLDTAKYFNGEY
ncbi:MAG: hypothetical protein KAI45_06565, partial [Melioribacteraceae bacterium]|nr:hypothetical protein [Melioribacteraceae bacterium]